MLTKRNYPGRSILAMLVAAAGLLPASGVAQDLVIEEIIVAARQRSESLQDIPAAISAVSADTMERLALNNLEQIANVVPNLRISYGSSGASSQVFLRGIGTGAGSAGFSSAVGLVIDGVHYERGRWIQQGIFDLEQVVILKGPQALYFGKNNPAGLIVLKSRTPGETLQFNAKMGYETMAGESYIEAGLSVPVSDKLAIRLATRHTEMDGWINNTAQEQTGVDPLGFVIPGAGTSKDLPGSKDTVGRLTAVWQPSDSVDVTFRVGFADNKDAGVVATSVLVGCYGANGRPQPIFGVPSPFNDCLKNFDSSKTALPAELLANEPSIFGNGVPFTDYESTNSSLQIEWGIGALHFTSVTGLQNYDVVSLENFTYSDDGQVAGFESTNFEQFSQEFRVVSDFTGAVNFLAGVLVTEGDLRFRNSSRVAPLPPDSTTGRLFSWDKVAEESSSAWSVYADLIWDINDRWEMSAGARYSNEQRDSSIRVDYLHEILILLGALSPQGFDNRFEDSDVSPQFSLSYRPRDNVTLFAAYREGFKSGGFDASFLLGPGSSIADLTFNSEKADGVELGVKSNLLDGSLRLNATAYSITFEDLQVQQFNAATTQFTIDNAAKATTKGLEVDFDWIASDAFRLRGAFNYNDAKYNEFLASCYAGQSVQAGCASLRNPLTGGFSSQDLAGQSLAVAPRVVFSLGGSYDFEVGDWFASLAADARYSDEYNAAISKIPDAVQSSFTVLDASFRLLSPSQEWELSIIGRNLSDEKIAVHGDDRPLSGGAAGFPAGDPNLGLRSDAFVRLQRGRQIWAMLSYHFDR